MPTRARTKVIKYTWDSDSGSGNSKSGVIHHAWYFSDIFYGKTGRVAAEHLSTVPAIYQASATWGTASRTSIIASKGVLANFSLQIWAELK